MKDLAAWLVAPGIYWFQTTSPNHAKKFDKREDTRRVEVNGINHYRRTYEMTPCDRRKADRVLKNYESPASDRFSGLLAAKA